MIVSGMIFGFDCQREGFDSSQVKIGYLLSMPRFILELAEIKPIRAIHEIDGRQD